MVRNYYKRIHERAPGTGTDVEFGKYLRGIMKRLGKLYPSRPMKWIPLLAGQMRQLRGVLKLD